MNKNKEVIDTLSTPTSVKAKVVVVFRVTPDTKISLIDAVFDTVDNNILIIKMIIYKPILQLI